MSDSYSSPSFDSDKNTTTVVKRVDNQKPKKKFQETGERDVSVDDVDFTAAPGTLAGKLGGRLETAAEAFEAERFQQAHDLLKDINKKAPDVPEVLELHGLTYYRLGNYQNAVIALERFEGLTQSVEQHPVLADCHRAMNHWKLAEQLWDELGDSDPSSELVEEGRIVQAGVLSDQGKLDVAVELLEEAPEVPKEPTIYHLRRWYTLASLYEKAGDIPQARKLFKSVLRHEPTFGDAAERVAALD